MTDQDTPLSRLRELVDAFIEERDWRQFHNPKDLAAAISIEGAELQELFLWKSSEEVQASLQQEAVVKSIQEELADIMIYCLSLANRLDMDVTTAVLNKVEANRRKYPIEKAKGNYTKYTDL